MIQSGALVSIGRVSHFIAVSFPKPSTEITISKYKLAINSKGMGDPLHSCLHRLSYPRADLMQGIVLR